MNTNTDETFIRTSPPLNRFTVKLGGPAPWEILSAADARRIAQDIRLFVAAGILSGLWGDDAATLRRYADAVDALTQPPTLDLSVEALNEQESIMDKLNTFEDLLGKVLLNVENRNDEELVFTLDTGEKYKLYHSQDCCESVLIDDIVGDLGDLVNPNRRGRILASAQRANSRVICRLVRVKLRGRYLRGLAGCGAGCGAGCRVRVGARGLNCLYVR